MSSSTVGACGCDEKTSWPEVVGLSVEEAKKIILKDKPDADTIVLPVGTPVTKDFRPNLVRVFIDTVAGRDAPCWLVAQLLPFYSSHN